MKKALFPFLLCFAFAAAWYYWQQRPVPPFMAKLLPFEDEAITQISLHIPQKAALQLHYSAREWIAEQGSRSLVVRSPKPKQILARLLNMESQGLAKTGPNHKQIAAYITLQGEDIKQQLTFYELEDSSGRKTYVQLNELPDYYYLPHFSLNDLPLNFEDYEDLRLLDLAAWPSVDSLVWLQDSSRYSLFQRPKQASQLDSLHQAWYQLKGEAFATEFDEVGEQDRYLGTYRIFGADDSLDLYIYHDTNWPDTLVVGSSQFPKNFFWLKKRWW